MLLIHIVSFIVTAIIIVVIVAVLARFIDAVTAVDAEPLADAVTMRIDGNLPSRVTPIILQPDIIVIVVIDIQQFVHLDAPCTR